MKDITNYVQLTDDIATSGQPTAEQFKTIAECGFAAVINLAMPDSAARSPILDHWEPDMDPVWRDFLAIPAVDFLSW